MIASRRNLALLLLVLVTPLAAPAEVGSAKAPSGARYLVTSKGPIEGEKGSKALGLVYQIDSLADSARVAAEASDLMSALLPEAELGKFESVVITAAEGKKQGGRAKSFNTAFARGPAGEWLPVKGGVSDKAFAARLAAAYAASDVAFGALDEKAIRGLCSSGFLHGLIDGSARTLDQDLAAARGAIKSVAAWKTTASGYYRRQSQVFVMTTQTWTGEVFDAQRKAVRISSTTTALDTWVDAGGRLVLDRSQDLQERTEPAP